MKWSKLGLLSFATLCTFIVIQNYPSSKMARAGCPSLFNPFCTPPVPQRKSETHDIFHIKNESNASVYFAYIEYQAERGNDLNSIDPAQWYSQGWWTINPGETRSVYETRSRGSKIYVRIESSNGGVLTPTSYTDVTDFCSSHQKYSSWKSARSSNGRYPDLSIQIGDGSRRQGYSCREVGGEMNTFWQLPANTTFTVR